MSAIDKCGHYRQVSLYTMSLVTMMVTYAAVNHDTGSKVGIMLNIHGMNKPQII